MGQVQPSSLAWRSQKLATLAIVAVFAGCGGSGQTSETVTTAQGDGDAIIKQIGQELLLARDYSEPAISEILRDIDALPPADVARAQTAALASIDDVNNAGVLSSAERARVRDQITEEFAARPGPDPRPASTTEAEVPLDPEQALAFIKAICGLTVPGVGPEGTHLANLREKFQIIVDAATADPDAPVGADQRPARDVLFDAAGQFRDCGEPGLAAEADAAINAVTP